MPRHEPGEGKPLKPMAQIETRYYLRLTAADRPGVLAKVSRVFGDLEISISSAIQQETDAKTQTAEIVLMTYPAKEMAMQQALSKIAPVYRVRGNWEVWWFRHVDSFRETGIHELNGDAIPLTVRGQTI